MKNFGPTKYPRNPNHMMTIDTQDQRWYVTHKISNYYRFFLVNSL